jgi:hypothetical protein
MVATPANTGILLHHLVSDILVCEILVTGAERRLKFGLFALGYALSILHDYVRADTTDVRHSIELN